MFGIKRDIYVFGGPSLTLIPKNVIEKLIVLPPIKRDDLHPLIQLKRPAICLIVDGIFGANMSVTPTECRLLLENGWMLCGCSSMGALRAADLWSLGMIGIGYIYNLFRLGHLNSDAEVAVLYEQSENAPLQESTVSLVHLRYLLKILRSKNQIDVALSNKMILKGQQIFWGERNWESLFTEWEKLSVTQQTLTELNSLKDNPRYHPKKTDALEAVSLLLNSSS